MRSRKPIPVRDLVSVLSSNLSPVRWSSALLACVLGLAPAVANSAEGEDDKTDEGAEETDPTTAASFQVRFKLPGAESAIEAPSPAQLGEPLEWDVEADGQRHEFRVRLEALDTSDRLGVRVDYRRDESSLVEARTEVDMSSWSSLETTDGATLELWIAPKKPKKRKKITIEDGDNPLDGL